MNINNVSSANSAAGMRSMQRPDPSKMAEDLFSKLDGKGQGYIERSDLEAALGHIGNSNSKHASDSAEQMFSARDGNGDGKVTQQEMAATFEKVASELDGAFPRMRMLDQGDCRLGHLAPAKALRIRASLKSNRPTRRKVWKAAIAI